MKNLVKVINTFFLLIVFFVGFNLVHAQEVVDVSAETPTNTSTQDKDGLSPYTPLAPIPGLSDKTISGKLDGSDGGNVITLPDYIKILVRVAIGIIGILSVVMIIIGGVQYMSTDAFSGKEDGKERVTKAIGGLVLAIASVMILRTINPQLTSIGFSKFESVRIDAEDIKVLEKPC
jgi:hypothetical protein